MQARKLVISTLLLICLVFLLLFKTVGYTETYKLFYVPSLSPHFLDLRSITHGAESYAQGLDPMRENPADPLQRTVNYPRVWQVLYYFGLNQSHTTAFGLILITCFFMGIVLILPHASVRLMLLIAAAVVSPATLLAIERANIDLLMFGIVAGAIICIKCRVELTLIFLMLGCFLKIFPIFAATILVRLKPKACLIGLMILVSFTSLYVYYTLDDLKLIREGTPASTGASFGKDVLWMRAAEFKPVAGTIFKILTSAIICGIAALGGWLLLMRDPNQADEPDSLAKDCFRAGASIYVCTFLLGNNFDYRLIFLTFTIPQLMEWLHATNMPRRVLAIVTLTAVYISLWGFMIRGLCDALPGGREITYLLDESANWSVWIGSLLLLSTSMPSWVSELVQSQLKLRLTEHSLPERINHNPQGL